MLSSIMFRAAGTVEISSSGERDLPRTSASSAADPFAPGGCHRAAFDLQRFAVEQRIGHDPVCMLENSAERGSRDVHLGGRLLLLIAFEVGEADGLELIQGQDNALEICHRPPLRLEE